MIPKRGEILLINLNPQRKKEAGKIRPCIVLSETEVNGILDLITIVPCTTNLLGEGLFRIFIGARDRMDRDCEAMVEQIRGVSRERIVDRLSVTTDEEMGRIEEGIRALLAL
ncbi:type II toxin-antitoxin system PemK/MazF family toxin [Nitratifractor sp.]